MPQRYGRIRTSNTCAYLREEPLRKVGRSDANSETPQAARCSPSITGRKTRASGNTGWRLPARRSTRSRRGNPAPRATLNPVSYTPTAAKATAWHCTTPTSHQGLLEPGAVKAARRVLRRAGRREASGLSDTSRSDPRTSAGSCSASESRCTDGCLVERRTSRLAAATETAALRRNQSRRVRHGDLSLRGIALTALGPCHRTNRRTFSDRAR
jgi:hypothetical protein